MLYCICERAALKGRKCAAAATARHYEQRATRSKCYSILFSLSLYVCANVCVQERRKEKVHLAECASGADWKGVRRGLHVGNSSAASCAARIDRKTGI
jgi:hypothetical protein